MADKDKKMNEEMKERGASRPMAMNSIHGEEGHGKPGSDMRYKMLAEHHKKTHWIYWLIIILGLWMIFTPLTFSFSKANIEPAGGRELWISLENRINILKWSDIISGFLLIFFGYRSLKSDRPVSLWLACFIGIWLNAAPLIFWAPNPLIYLNDTMAGTLIIALTILIPGMPNMINYMEMGPNMPPGWTYNPSSWTQRSILIFLGLLGWFVSRYLAAFQLGYTDYVWEPFFGDGSKKVLTSKMSETWPISDGGLGAFSYTFEFLMGWMGSPSRWRTMPWMVLFFGFLVIPLGLTHIFLVISQPVVVGHWCSMCLLAALIMLPMIPLEIDEVIAMLQFMKQSRKEGKSLWKTFWLGGTIEGEDDKRSPEISEFTEKPWQIFRASIWGMSFPPTLLASSAIGLWLIFSPAIFSDSQTLAKIENLSGALIITFSVIAMGESIRTFRFVNILIALLVMLSPFIFESATNAGTINNIICGIIVIGLSIPRGKLKESFGSWDKYIY